MLRVFNTLTDRLEEFEPLQKGRVQMYVCGPTVYDHAHIGHGRAYVAFDVIVRYLRHRGYKVTYVRNLTDIDDKIIRRSQEEKVGFHEVSTKYISSFHEDMKNLRLTDPDHEPKATETIPEMIAMIQTLISAGKAYPVNGDVYFSVSKQKDYGKLSKKNLEDLKAGARVEPGEQKKNPLDFALWKAAKKDEPSWPSPWGAGRPGWHIECSAMVKKLLGESIDIHAGGRDLIFPHHENEIAQSEGVHQKPFAKYWLHNGFVNIDKQKMSKSLGNFVTLKKLLEEFHPEALKLFLLTSHYRSPVDFSDSLVKEAARGLDRIYRVLLSIPMGKSKEPDENYRQRFEEAMDDDFNSAKAVAVIFDAVKEANRLQKKSETIDQASRLRETIIALGNVLGILHENPAAYFQSLAGEDIAQIETLIAKRAEARRQKNFQEADKIRDQLTALNVTVEDGPDGTTWRH